jgi:hypothetical protein
MKGDYVEVVVDSGNGKSAGWMIAASKAGRRVEVGQTRGGIIEIAEVTRNGEAVRTARFMASRVIAVVEHPADGAGDG